jgi:hypothetical protein
MPNINAVSLNRPKNVAAEDNDSKISAKAIDDANKASVFVFGDNDASDRKKLTEPQHIRYFMK